MLYESYIYSYIGIFRMEESSRILHLPFVVKRRLANIITLKSYLLLMLISISAILVGKL